MHPTCHWSCSGPLASPSMRHLQSSRAFSTGAGAGFTVLQRGTWPFADKRRPEIDAHFAKLQREKPALWNGRVLLLHRYDIDRHVFGGAFLETDFASFVAWRDWGFPDAGVTNCFSMCALRASDGAYVLGVIGAHTEVGG